MWIPGKRTAHHSMVRASSRLRGVGAGGGIPVDGAEIAWSRQADHIGYHGGFADKALGVEQNFGQVVEKAGGSRDAGQPQIEEADFQRRIEGVGGASSGVGAPNTGAGNCDAIATV